MNITDELKEKIKNLPTNPGVYLMSDVEGTIIYVGKAINLSNRVRQYFGANAQKQAKVAAMVENIHTFEYIITDTELEALILECNLIKKYRPHYNILLKDDKQYPYVRINFKKKYPKVELVRKVEKDDSKYFGPFLAAHTIRDTIDTLYKIFPLRSCNKDLEKPNRKPDRPCLNYQMGRCTAPCAGLITEEEYKDILNKVVELLNGKFQGIHKMLLEQMQQAADVQDYEKAAVLRDKLFVLKRMAEHQKVGFADLNDKDIFAVVMGEQVSVVQAFFVRSGKLSGAERFYMSQGDSKAEILESFLKQFYLDKSVIPRTIYVGEELEDSQIIQEWLSEQRKARVELIYPKRGDNRKLLELAETNAREALVRKENSAQRQKERTVGAAEELGEILGIGYIQRMECFDISNIQGTDSVASMVVFTDGKPDKKEYRRFKIKTVEGPNDFASMAEVLTRRLTEGLKVKDKSHGFGKAPNLIIVDGGKGQLSTAVEVLESLGLENIPIVGLAKREEEIFLPGESESILLDKNSNPLRLITAIRDEAHRFAITYHRAIREKRTLHSILDDIPGVGPKRKQLILSSFKNIDSIISANLETLEAVKGVDKKTALAVYNYFRSDKKDINKGS